MKIGFDAKRAFCNSRGLGNYSRGTIAALTRLRPDNEYFLFTPEKRPEFQNLSYPNSTIISPTTAADRAMPSLWRTFRCTREISARNLDIFHGLSHELPLGIGRCKARSVVTIHDLIFITHPQLYPAIDRMTYTLKYRHSCNAADKIIAISQQTKTDIVNHWKIPEEKIEVVYQGCNPIFQKPVSEDEINNVRNKYNLPTEYLLHVGAIERRKNQAVILQAMKGSKHDIPLVLVGSGGEYLKTLQHDFPDLFASRVILLRRVPDRDLRAIYAAASIFIYPSLYEGFGIPILEAMSCGVPTITTSDGCFREAGGAACRYINPNAPNQLSEEINILLDDSGLRSECVARGRQQMSKFTEENIAAKLSEIYETIL